MPDTQKIEILRAEEEWQRAGAYSVRIQGMNRCYHISLREEFDEHDCDGTRYIVLLDDGYPVATCRFYETAPHAVMLGRVVVLPEYRGRHLGALAVREAVQWAAACGYTLITIESRTEAVGFYEKLGFVRTGEAPVQSGCFVCIPMQKSLGKNYEEDTAIHTAFFSGGGDDLPALGRADFP